MPTSFLEPSGAPLPDSTRPASSTTSSGDGPEPSICTLQRRHGPRLGIPCGSGRPVGVTGGARAGARGGPGGAVGGRALGGGGPEGRGGAPPPVVVGGRARADVLGAGG